MWLTAVVISVIAASSISCWTLCWIMAYVGHGGEEANTKQGAGIEPAL